MADSGEEEDKPDKQQQKEQHWQLRIQHREDCQPCSKDTKVTDQVTHSKISDVIHLRITPHHKTEL